jgi:hypothetical protein
MFKYYPTLFIWALSSILLTPIAFAQELSLEDVWESVSAHSKTKESSSHTVMAAEARFDRSAKHWLPRLYFDARTFTTNDPGTALFSKLAQRKVDPNDFIPTRLNHPNAQWYQRATLGLDLPIYEGGYKSAIHKANEALFHASPQEVERKITEPVERAVWGLHGVEYIYSASQKHGALITVRFSKSLWSSTLP